MRLLVFSDSHGSVNMLDRALRAEKKTTHVFFLGDVTDDIEELIPEYKDKIFHTVSGNCDFFKKYPTFDTVKVGDVNIFMAHGHTFEVNYGTDKLLQAAKTQGAQIALYGHTHINSIEYKDGVYIINPGSVSRSRNGANSYAVIDILDNGILPAVKNL